MRPTLWALAATLLSASPALADDGPAGPPVDAWKTRLDPVGKGLPGLPGTELLGLGTVHLGLGLGTAIDPLEGATETPGALLSRITTLEVGLAVGVGPADVFVRIPLHLAIGGTADARARPSTSGFTGPGDVGFGATVRILDVRELTFGLAGRLEVTVPTGAEGESLGWGGPTVRPSLVTEFRAWRIRFSTETALHVRPPAEAWGVAAGPLALELGMGLSITPTEPTELRALELGLGLDSRPELPTPGDTAISDLRRPLEWRFFLIGRPTPCIAVHASAGTGIGRGWGTPAARVLGGLDITVGREGAGCGPRSVLH